MNCSVLEMSIVSLEKWTSFSMPISNQWIVCGSCVKHLKSYGACSPYSSWTGAPSSTWVLRTACASGSQLPSNKSWNYIWLPGASHKGFFWPPGGKISWNIWSCTTLKSYSSEHLNAFSLPLPIFDLNPLPCPVHWNILKLCFSSCNEM